MKLTIEPTEADACMGITALLGSAAEASMAFFNTSMLPAPTVR